MLEKDISPLMALITKEEAAAGTEQVVKGRKQQISESLIANFVFY
jgi:hypothetical protein